MPKCILSSCNNANYQLSIRFSVQIYTSETTSEVETEKCFNGLEYMDKQKSTFTAKRKII